ncbi:hypothetical protein ANANG_G00176530 [Anguilla anguilla]|uniref:Alpha-L-fucosidase n=1 Tax=Anguilla anguilla TaxID=7936 RepID=A0A9D3M5W6_ANGAN|nr:hypothetical protein ANANG_G00176530 [Anguilla anguilla]
MIHWGVYAVPGFGSEWFWCHWQGEAKSEHVEFMKKNYPPGFTYQQFAPDFRAQFFDPDQWAELFEASGAKYVVLTAKHHDGFATWGSPHSWNWNSVDTGPHRDLVEDLGVAVRKRSLRYGIYYSLYEWFHPLYLSDKKSGFRTQEFVFSKVLPELHDLVTRYKPDLIESNGDWAAPDSYWNSTEFLAWLYNDSPVKDSVVINDQWGAGCVGNHGGFYRYQQRFRSGQPSKHKWENHTLMDTLSWGYRRNMRLNELRDLPSIIQDLVRTVADGGNYLLNVGPTAEGTIPPVFEERLRGLGDWLKVNGEAVYASRPWRVQSENSTQTVWYTSKGSQVYAFFLVRPSESWLKLAEPITSPSTKVMLLGYSEQLSWSALQPSGLKVELPREPFVNGHGWTLRLDGVK